MGNEEKILQHILEQLQDRERTLSDSLCSGGMPDFAEYKNLCGQIQGLVFAQYLIKDLVRKLEKFDE